MIRGPWTRPPSARRGSPWPGRSSYIPCVSLLDFWLPAGTVELVAYAHSIDFGAKGYGNLVELAWLQRHVASALGRPAGRPLMIVKSANVYQTEFGYVRGVLDGVTDPQH